MGVGAFGQTYKSAKGVTINTPPIVAAIAPLDRPLISFWDSSTPKNPLRQQNHRRNLRADRKATAERIPLPSFDHHK